MSQKNANPKPKGIPKDKSARKQIPRREGEGEGDGEEESWATIKRVLLSRTLHVHSLSPINIPTPSSKSTSPAEPDPSSTHALNETLFHSLSSELFSFLNLKLSDPFNLASVGRDTDAGVDRDADAEVGAIARNSANSRKRRRLEVNKVGRVRMAWISDFSIQKDHQRSEGSEAPEAKLWCIEIEMGKPPSSDSENQFDSGVVPPPASSSKPLKHDTQSQIQDLCHLIFVPNFSRRSPSARSKPGSGSRSSSNSHPKPQPQPQPILHYPLLLTKSSSISAPQISKYILQTSLEWFSTRFDCRISSSSQLDSTSNPSLSLSLSPSVHLGNIFQSLVALESRFHSKVWTRKGQQQRQRQDKDQDKDGNTQFTSPNSKPIELSWSISRDFFLNFQDNQNQNSNQGIGKRRGQGRKKSGINERLEPKLKDLTMSVPLKVGLELLGAEQEKSGGEEGEEGEGEGEGEDVPPLLPLLRSYLSQHTSLPLHLFDLTRIAIGGVNLTFAKMKVESSSNRSTKVDGNVRATGNDDNDNDGDGDGDGDGEGDDEQMDTEMEELDRRRLNVVLRGLAGMISMA